ncbi:probable mitochondrial sodium/calcium exchanger protein [Coccomyxa sp. Obi]|nr:probable mitochondrial sodium/calcium exchanger protein [Coccomyxa sp. Obi]
MSWAVHLTRLLCLTSIVLLTCTACLASQESKISPSISIGRFLLDVENDANKAEQASCNAVKHLPEGSSECEYVKENCAKGSIISYVEIYFCYVRPAGQLPIILYQVACILWLLLLFRVLGSTAEEFFSPILTQLSQELGLPPRFAGVTFLALGNGAPDISSSVAAITAGNYMLAISSLLGGGLFVGCVVAGAIMLANGGAKARGALMRDVAAYCIGVVTITAFMWTGKMTYFRSLVLLVVYAAFVITVLGADLWHIFTRDADAEQKPEAESLLHEEQGQGRRRTEPVIPPAADLYSATDQAHHVADSTIELTEKQHSTGSLPHSNEDRSEDGHQHHQAEARHHRVKHWLDQEDVHLMSGRGYRARALAELANSSTFNYRVHSQELRQASMEASLLSDQEAGPERALTDGYQPPEMLEADAALPDVEEDVGDADAAERGVHPPPAPGEGDRRRKHRRSASMELGDPGGGPSGAAERASGCERAVAFCRRHCGAICSVLGVLERIASIAEWPLLVLRRATVPIVEQEFYSRPWFLTSLVFGPPAAMYYLQLGWVPMGIALGAGCVASALAAWATKSAKETPPAWRLGLSFPIGSAIIAAVGFVLAAMWIDTIATELVSMLEYLGLLSGISHTVLGLTVLAWGNSVGDMSTNMAMARKGLANMAMTACYAGPVFNLLVGAALGFIRLLASKGLASVQVQITENVVASCVCIIVMCVGVIGVGLTNKYHLPAKFGLLLIGMYIAYLTVSILLLVT